MKYHISPKTGRPNQCRAGIRSCPVGGAHFDSKEAARNAYEAENDTLPVGLSKYDVYDRPLRGTGTGPGGRDATLQRMQQRPHIDYMDSRDEAGNYCFDVTANGEFIYRAQHRAEIDLIHRAIDAGQWPALRELLRHNEDSTEMVDELLQFRQGDLDEELEGLEDQLATEGPDMKPRAYHELLDEVEQYRTAVNIRNHERRRARQNVDETLATLKTHFFKTNFGTHEDVYTAQEFSLGRINRRGEGKYEAQVNDSRRVRSLGTFASRDEALRILALNNGEDQRQ